MALRNLALAYTNIRKLALASDKLAQVLDRRVRMEPGRPVLGPGKPVQGPGKLVAGPGMASGTLVLGLDMASGILARELACRLAEVLEYRRCMALVDIFGPSSWW